jgi:hypothetical protein
MVVVVVVFFIYWNCQNMLTALLDICKTRYHLVVISGVVRLLYQEYADVPWNHKTIFNSIHTKHGGKYLQELMQLLTVTLCCWPAVNKAVSPCVLSIIFA